MLNQKLKVPRYRVKETTFKYIYIEGMNKKCFIV